MHIRSRILIIAATLLSAATAAATAAADGSPAPIPPREFAYPGGTGHAAARRPYPGRHPESRGYGEPARHRDHRGFRSPVVTQLSAGLYSPSGPSATSFLLGARVGPQVDRRVQLGLLLDWAHKEDRVSATFGHETVGGVDLSLEDSRLRGRSDLVPLLAFVQISGRDTSRLIPYGGVAAGYEFLAMEAERADGSRFDGTFGGWGWQLWAGAALPLSDRARLNGEFFVNSVDLGRDVRVDGRVLRQTASFNGPGLRVGVSWGF